MHYIYYVVVPGWWKLEFARYFEAYTNGMRGLIRVYRMRTRREYRNEYWLTLQWSHPFCVLNSTTFFWERFPSFFFNGLSGLSLYLSPQDVRRVSWQRSPKFSCLRLLVMVIGPLASNPNMFNYIVKVGNLLSRSKILFPQRQLPGMVWTWHCQLSKSLPCICKLHKIHPRGDRKEDFWCPEILVPILEALLPILHYPHILPSFINQNISFCINLLH